MPTYQMAAPNGQTYQVDGPAGASDDDVRAEIMRQHPEVAGGAPAAPAVPASQLKAAADAKKFVRNSTLGSGQVQAFGQGASLGWVDEADAVTGAGVTMANNALHRIGIGGGAGYTSKEAYQAIMDAERNQMNDFAKVHPVQNVALNVAGGVLSPVAKLGAAAEGATLAARVGRGAAVGAGLGAVAGAGQGQGAERLSNAGIGAVTGGVLGGAVPVGAEGFKTGLKAVNAATGNRLISVASSAASRLRDALSADGVDQATINQAVDSYTRTGALDPTLADVGGENTRALLRVAGAKPGAARNMAQEYRDTTAEAMPDAAVDRASQLTGSDQRPAAQVASELDATRAKQATKDYEGPYQTQVPLSDDLQSMLSDESGRQVLRDTRADAVERQDTAQVAEIDRILAQAPPKPGVVKLSPVEAPEAPPPEGDPRGVGFLAYLRNLGGIKDEGGELSAMDLGRSGDGRFQKNWLSNPSGISLEHAAQRAWEDGWFPEAKMPTADTGDNYNPVTGDHLLDAIRKTVRGEPPNASWEQQADEASRHRWMDDAEDPRPATGDDWWNSLDQGKPTVSAATLDRAQIAYRERAGQLAAQGNNARASGALGRRDQINATLDSIPELGPARSTYKGYSQAIEGVQDIGPRIMSQSPAEFSASLKDLPDMALDAARVGARERITSLLGQRANASPVLRQIAFAPNARKNLTALFGADEASRFIESAKLNLQKVKNADYIAPNTNSQTFSRGQDENVISSAVNFVRKPVQAILEKVTRGLTLTDAEAAELMKMGLMTPQAAAAKVFKPNDLIAPGLQQFGGKVARSLPVGTAPLNPLMQRQPVDQVAR